MSRATRRDRGWRPAPALALGLALAATPTAPAAAADPRPGAAPVDYNRDVRPLLAKKCLACHGQDETNRKAGLRLDRRDDAVRELKSGATAVVPGNPDESELVARVVEEDASLRMPPAKDGPKLTAAEVDVLRRWVAQGATYAEHWAFVAPQRRPLPAVKDQAWPRNGIDHWVLARLEAEKLRPSPEADRYTLLRRASLDLRGLPPSPQEVDRFAADTAPDAYEKAVDRFLSDGAYGERMARLWLDLARYADSAGYGSDPLRTIWRYRDWVIDAYNRNLPYDRFTVEQLAGDLLPNPTLDQKIATAFHRNTMTNTEGGTDDEEFRVAAIKDRVDSTWQVWMGLTMGCAKCHSHKYDPLSQDDYYRFFAVFNQTADADKPDESPVLPAPTAEDAAKNRAIDARLAELRAQLDRPTPALAEGQARWEADLTGPVDWVKLNQEATETKGTTSTLRVRVRGLEKVTAVEIQAPSEKGGAAAVVTRVTAEAGPAGGAEKGAVGRFVRVELPGRSKFLSLAEVQVFRGDDNLARKGKARQSSTDFDGDARRAIDGNTDGDYYGANSTTHSSQENNPWWEVDLGKAEAVDRVVVWNRTDGAGDRLAKFKVTLLDADRKPVWTAEVAEPPSPSRALALSGRRPVGLVGWDGDWTVKPGPSGNATLVLGLKDPVRVDTPTDLTLTLETKAGGPALDASRLVLGASSDARVSLRAALPKAVRAALDVPAQTRTKAQSDTLERHYRSTAPELKAVRDEIAKLEKSRPAAPTVPVMAELPADRRRSTFFLNKGNFLAPGPKVDAGLPRSFPPLPAGTAPDRLGVARWLVDPANPLTARVAVNRYWAQLFGTGLVETEEDFGTQGDPPSHPELLDWLATEYVRIGWDTKAILRLIVTSASYRQSSRVTPELLKADPRNRLLSRGPRFRLEAEMVRDQALAFGGLLSRKVGGPSVFPPQPDGLWQAAFNGQRTWATSAGEDRHRRALYTFWRRTIPYPSMATFDAPSREICAVKRTRTNTPLQAFVTMNDPVYVEAAQAFARRIAAEGGGTPESRARFALRLALGRPASEVSKAQVDRLVALYRTEREHYAADAAAARALATEPIGPLPKGADAADLAAWTTVANVLLNLDAVLTKG